MRSKPGHWGMEWGNFSLGILRMPFAGRASENHPSRPDNRVQPNIRICSLQVIKASVKLECSIVVSFVSNLAVAGNELHLLTSPCNVSVAHPYYRDNVSVVCGFIRTPSHLRQDHSVFNVKNGSFCM